MSKIISWLVYSNFIFYTRLNPQKSNLSNAKYIIDFTLLFIFINFFLISRLVFGRIGLIDLIFIFLVLTYLFFFGRYFHRVINRAIISNKAIYRKLRGKKSILLFFISHFLMVFLFLLIGYFGSRIN